MAATPFVTRSGVPSISSCATAPARMFLRTTHIVAPAGRPANPVRNVWSDVAVLSARHRRRCAVRAVSTHEPIRIIAGAVATSARLARAACKAHAVLPDAPLACSGAAMHASTPRPMPTTAENVLPNATPACVATTTSVGAAAVTGLSVAAAASTPTRTGTTAASVETAARQVRPATGVSVRDVARGSRAAPVSVSTS